jgi:putative transposase
MMAQGREAVQVEVTARQRAILEEILRRTKSPQSQVQRVSIVLQAAAGMRNKHIALGLDVHEQTVRDWRGRWAEGFPRLQAAESEVDDKELRGLIVEVLSDRPRSGSPPTFSAEQVCQIIAVACEHPEDSDCPVSHWSPRELRAEVVRRGIVEDISVRSVGRFLKSGRLEAPPVSILAQSRKR